MKKVWLGLVVALVAVLGAGLIAGCSSPEKYSVFSYGSDGDYTEYDIVYYAERSGYEGEMLTRFIDETHYSKDYYAYEDVQSVTSNVYPGIDSMSFVSVSITDEGDYYCCIVDFDDLDNVANLQTLHASGTLFSESADASGDKLVDADYFMNSIAISGYATLSEDEVNALGLHALA